MYLAEHNIIDTPCTRARNMGVEGPGCAVVNVGTFMLQSLGVSELYFVKMLPLPISAMDE
jgi:hypothetical protein